MPVWLSLGFSTGFIGMCKGLGFRLGPIRVSYSAGVWVL